MLGFSPPFLVCSQLNNKKQKNKTNFVVNWEKNPLNLYLSCLQCNKPIKHTFSWPADHQYLSEEGSCTADSMDSFLNGSDGCSLKSKNDFCENGHKSCLLNLKWWVQIHAGGTQPWAPKSCWLECYVEGDKVFRGTSCLFLYLPNDMHKVKYFTNNGSNIDLVMPDFSSE